MGFEQSPHEVVVYRRGSGGNALLVGIYVDDLVITGTKDAKVAAFKEDMKATYQMSDMGPSPSTWESRRQTAYAKRVVELAGVTDCNPTHSNGGEGEAEPRQHDEGSGRHTVPASCGEPSLPRPHKAGLGILRQLR
jgi:hypothetical protein